MTIYVIIGYDSQKFEIQYENVDILDIEKFYLLGNEEIEDNEKFKSITDKNVLTFYEENNLENSESNIVFIDCREGIKTYFDVMYFLNTGRFVNRSYYVFKPTKSVKILNIKDYPFKENYNPWNGDALPESISKVERDTIMEMYYNAVLIIKEYLKCDFHLKRTSGIPDGWMMNTSTPILSHVINYYGLHPNAKDVPSALEFCHNTQYRQIMTKTLIHICSNFLIKNKIVNYLPENKSEDFWFKLETWNSIEI
jgi:hypothetical protein